MDNCWVATVIRLRSMSVFPLLFLKKCRHTFTKAVNTRLAYMPWAEAQPSPLDVTVLYQCRFVQGLLCAAGTSQGIDDSANAWSQPLFWCLGCHLRKNINEDELSFVCSLFAVELPKKLWWINVNKAPAFTQWRVCIIQFDHRRLPSNCHTKWIDILRSSNKH